VPPSAGCAPHDTTPLQQVVRSAPRLAAKRLLTAVWSTGDVGSLTGSTEQPAVQIDATSATLVFGRHFRPMMMVGCVMPCVVKCELS